MFSANVQANQAIDALLDVAQYDPSHRDAVKEFHKANDMTFYEAVSYCLIRQRDFVM